MPEKSTNTLIQTDIRQGILRVRLNRPDKKNSINREMYAGLTRALTEAEENDDIRVIYLCGDEHCFTAGNDLFDFLAVAEEGNPPTEGAAFIRLLAQITTPIVAAVGGPAVGIGTTILLHCDLVYAAENARFRLPFVELGLCPEAGSSYLLPKLAGYQAAAEILLLGEFFDAHKAREIGLVADILPEENLLPVSWQKAEKLASLPQEALKITKQLMKRATAKMTQETIEEELTHFTRQLFSEEARDAFIRFFEKK